jgi:hypothetical protein
MAKEYANRFHSKAIQNLPKLEFLVQKYIYVSGNPGFGRLFFEKVS